MYVVKFTIYSTTHGNESLTQNIAHPWEAWHFSDAVKACVEAGPTNEENKLFASKYRKNSYVRSYQGIFKVTEERLD
jgi:hypothetical protein